MNNKSLSLIIMGGILAFFQGCNPYRIQGTFTPTSESHIPASTQPKNSKSGQVSYLRWAKHYQYVDSLWTGADDGSRREIAFKWLGLTKRNAFIPDGSGMIVWMQEATGGMFDRYIIADLTSNLPGPCVTCNIEEVTYPPIPSPQSDKLAIVSNSGLYITYLKTQETYLIVPMDRKNGLIAPEPSWSPDGLYIALSIFSDNSRTSIYKIKNDGTNLTNLTPTENVNEENGSPNWSPRGDQIAYISSDQTVRIMNIDGTDVQVLADFIPYTEAWSVLGEQPPQWSPDGKKLLFSTAIDTNGKADVVVINADGTNWTNLTNTPDSFELEPVWSPDGKKIAFSTNRDGNWEIYVMNADGSNPINISQSPETNEDYPLWRP